MIDHFEKESKEYSEALEGAIQAGEDRLKIRKRLAFTYSEIVEKLTKTAQEDQIITTDEGAILSILILKLLGGVESLVKDS